MNKNHLENELYNYISEIKSLFTHGQKGGSVPSFWSWTLQKNELILITTSIPTKLPYGNNNDYIIVGHVDKIEQKTLEGASPKESVFLYLNNAYVKQGKESFFYPINTDNYKDAKHDLIEWNLGNSKILGLDFESYGVQGNNGTLLKLQSGNTLQSNTQIGKLPPPSSFPFHLGGSDLNFNIIIPKSKEDAEKMYKERYDGIRSGNSYELPNSEPLMFLCTHVDDKGEYGLFPFPYNYDASDLSEKKNPFAKMDKISGDPSWGFKNISEQGGLYNSGDHEKLPMLQNQYLNGDLIDRKSDSKKDRGWRSNVFFHLLASISFYKNYIEKSYPTPKSGSQLYNEKLPFPNSDIHEHIIYAGYSVDKSTQDKHVWYTHGNGYFYDEDKNWYDINGYDEGKKCLTFVKRGFAIFGGGSDTVEFPEYVELESEEQFGGNDTVEFPEYVELENEEQFGGSDTVEFPEYVELDNISSDSSFNDQKGGAAVDGSVQDTHAEMLTMNAGNSYPQRNIVHFNTPISVVDNTGKQYDNVYKISAETCFGGKDNSGNTHDILSYDYVRLGDARLNIHSYGQYPAVFHHYIKVKRVITNDNRRTKGSATKWWDTDYRKENTMNEPQFGFTMAWSMKPAPPGGIDIKMLNYGKPGPFEVWNEPIGSTQNPLLKGFTKDDGMVNQGGGSDTIEFPDYIELDSEN